MALERRVCDQVVALGRLGPLQAVARGIMPHPSLYEKGGILDLLFSHLAFARGNFRGAENDCVGVSWN